MPIIKNVLARKSNEDQRHLNPKNTARISVLIAAVAANIEEDLCVSIKILASAHVVSVQTLQNFLSKDLSLAKRSARWVPQLLSEEQKLEKMRTLLAMTQWQSLAMMDNIVT